MGVSWITCNVAGCARGRWRRLFCFRFCSHHMICRAVLTALLHHTYILSYPYPLEIYLGHAPRTCTLDMYLGHAPWMPRAIPCATLGHACRTLDQYLGVQRWIRGHPWTHIVWRCQRGRVRGLSVGLVSGPGGHQ